MVHVFSATMGESTEFSDQVCGTHVAQLLHMGNQQGEAMSEGRVVFGADLFDQRAQQHLAVIGNGQDGCQLDGGVAKSRHHGCEQAAAGCAKIGFSDILKRRKF